MNLSWQSLLVSFALLTGVAQADDSVSAQDQFHTTFDRFIGEDWLFHIELFDAEENLTFKGVDIRRFEFGVGGTFVIENVYRMEDEAHIGIQLIGFNRQAGSIHLSTFFPWQATALADTEARFIDGGVEGTSHALLPDGSEVNARFACSWINDRWTCESRVINPDGSERLGDRNYYCRRSDPGCSEAG